MKKEKTYLKPSSVQEAVNMAYANDLDFHYLAGGTDVIVNKFQGNDNVSCLIDITGIEELKSVEKNGKHLRIGALVKLDELRNIPEIKDFFPALIEAAQAVASPIIRKSATIGGNLLVENRCSYYNQSEWWREAVGLCLKCEGDVCIATGGNKACFSKFVSDTAPVLICLDAFVEVADKKEGFIIRVEELYTGDGVTPRILSKANMIKHILIPLGNEAKVVFKKLRQRESLEFSSLTTAVSLNKAGKIKIALAGIDPKPVVVEGTKNDNKEELIKKAVKKSRIVDNDVFPREYRKEMISVYLRRSFEELGL